MLKATKKSVKALTVLLIATGEFIVAINYSLEASIDLLNALMELLDALSEFVVAIA